LSLLLSGGGSEKGKIEGVRGGFYKHNTITRIFTFCGWGDNKADFTLFEKTGLDGLNLMSGSSCQIFVKLNRGTLFVVAILWAGTNKSSTLRRAISGLRALFVNHVSLKENGNLA
jgi:hypothetical protein